jgi:hypothetical protein
MQNNSHNLFCLISSPNASFKLSIFLNEFAVAGPNPPLWLLAATTANFALFLTLRNESDHTLSSLSQFLAF